MIDDFSGGRPVRKKPKIIQPPERPAGPTIHELAAREGHDMAASENASAGPEASAALGFVGDHSQAASGSSRRHTNHQHSPINTASVAGKIDYEINEADATSDRPKARTGQGWRQKLSMRLSKKQWIIAASVLVVIVAAGGAVLALKWPGKSSPLVVNAAVAKPKPKPIYSPLSGMPVTAEQAKLPVTGVMIENTPQARPQSGLSQAGVVYEAIAEAGITRFLALFQEGQPSSIGPVRSARPYFVAWDDGYGAPYGHVGGSPDGLADIQSWGVKDMDQFGAPGSYHRIASREAPHNMYTSMSDLNALEASRGWNGPSNFTGFARKSDSPAKAPTAANISMNISSPDYAVNYVYDASADAYKRSEGGAAHVDANTNQQLEPKVVVALIIPYSYGALDSSGAYYSVYNNVGSGQAYVFQDGTVTQATWSKASNAAPLELLDASGKNIELNRGQTWLTALADSSELSYTP